LLLFGALFTARLFFTNRIMLLRARSKSIYKLATLAKMVLPDNLKKGDT